MYEVEKMCWCEGVPGTGVKLCDVFSAAIEKVGKDRPDLKDHFTRNVG